MKFCLVVLLVASVASASSVSRIKTPSPQKLMESIVEGTISNLKAKGWDVSKNLQTQYAELPTDITGDGAGASKITFAIHDASITGLANLRQMRSTSKISDDGTILSGTILATKVVGKVAYDINEPKEGGIPEDTVSGQASETVDNLFIDIQVKLNDYVPINLQSYEVRSGKNLVVVSGMTVENALLDVYLTGMKQSLRERIENTFATNVKVQLNQAIQALAAAAA